MNSNNQTGLRLAAQAGLLPALRLLLDAGAQVNQVDSMGKTCLEIANNSGNHSCRKLLLLWGAASAKLEMPQRASSLPNLAAEITEDQCDANTEEEEEEATWNKAESKAGCVKEGLEEDQELSQRVKEMQNELSELRKDVTRLRRERWKGDERRDEDENGSLTEQLDQVDLVERTDTREMASSRRNEFSEGIRDVSVTEGHNHPEGKESKSEATEIDSDFKTSEGEKALPVGMNNGIPPQTQESETQCNLGVETSKRQNPGLGVSGIPQHQDQQLSNQVETEEMSLPRLPGVGSGLVQIPPLVLPPCRNSTPLTRHSSTQCSLAVTNTAEERGASISSRDQHQHFVAAHNSRRKKHLGSEGEEVDNIADKVSPHQRRPGTSRIVYDQEDRRSWDGVESPLEGEEAEERFQYSSDEEVPLQKSHLITVGNLRQRRSALCLSVATKILVSWKREG